MSKHRKSRWANDGEGFTSLCGRVTPNSRGKWDAVVHVYRRVADANSIGYHACDEIVGEFKRVREAMMAVEERAVLISRRKDGAVRVDLDDSLL